jgi:hypothetical protein
MRGRIASAIEHSRRTTSIVFTIGDHTSSRRWNNKSCLAVRLLSEEEIYVGIKKMNMRSQSVLSKTNLLRWMINLLLLPPAIASATAYAQDAWQIDPNDSIATLSSGAGEVGVARVNGEVVFDSADPSDPTVRFSVNSNEVYGKLREYELQLPSLR